MNNNITLSLKKSWLISGIAVAIIISAGLGYWLGKGPAGTATDMAATEQEKKPLFYRNPMNPAITSPVPAQDEMGMDYIPVYEDGDEDSGSTGTVRIDPVTVQNIGVRTAVAEKKTISHTVRAVGRVTFDEQRLVRMHPKTAGWIEKLYVDKTGQSIRKDTILLSIYSPQLVSSQQEYLLALKNLETLGKSPLEDIRKGAEQLLESSLERLQLLDVAQHQIEELRQTGKIKKSLHIHSPAGGVVMKVGARQGQYVTPQTELYLLADLNKVWVNVDIYEQELPWVRIGDKAEMQLAGIPGRTFTGKVGFIYPYAEAKTRTIKVRIEFKNRDLALKPDMFADVTVFSGQKKEAIVIPTQAIIRSGTREQVFVVRAPGKFEPREVKLGITSEGETQILEGIKQGEEVVTSAQFLIDSESKLREATAKMLESNKQKTTTPETSPATDSTPMEMEHDTPIKHDMKMDHEMDMKSGTEMEHD